jgi:pimeloyl-ACP methyl ester carboxylesterase
MRFVGKNFEITVNDLTVSYNDEGPDDGPVIIFIHGFPFNKSMWRRQVEALKGSYRTITYDVRGHGNTEIGNKKFSIDLFATDLVGMMDELNIDTAILCGLSMGGYIALNAVEKYPERFEALILSDTQCKADTPETKEKRKKIIQDINETGVKNYADESIKNLFAPASFIIKQKEVAAIKQMIVNTWPQSLCSTLLALADRKEACNTLSEINIPVLIMVGKEDKITPPAAALLMHKRIHNSVMHVLDRAGHLANIENHYEFNYQLREFVDLVTKKSFCLSDTDGN